MKVLDKKLWLKASFALAGAVAAAGLASCTVSEVSYGPRPEPIYQAQPYALNSGYQTVPAQPGYYQQDYAQPQSNYVAPPQSSYVNPPQSTYVAPQQGYISPQPTYTAPQFDPSQISDLTASIALYPDPLLAVILPAATYPDEIVSADQWLRQNPNVDDATIDSLNLEPPVRALMHYPTVLQMMSDHADWTQALGAAFVNQQGDVFDSIQRWRATAEANGSLIPTPQQQVVQAGPQIEILPVQPDLIYVPEYDPSVVFLPGYHRDRDFIHFRVGGRSRRWLDDDMDWRDRVVRVPERHDWDRRDIRDNRDNRNDRNFQDDRRTAVAPPVNRTLDRRNTVVQQPQPVAPQQFRRDKDPRTPLPAPVARAPVAPVTPTAPRAVQAPTGVANPVTGQRNAFVRNSAKPNVTVPERVVLPQPDKKVVTVSPPKVQTASPQINVNTMRGPNNSRSGNNNGDKGDDGRGRADSR